MKAENDSSQAALLLLQQLNDDKALLYIPVIVFLGVLCLVGTLGNVLVLLVYWHKRYKASSHYFILSLALLDLLTCVVGLPTEIADLRYPYMFDAPVACKILRFVHSTTTISSSCILIQVAFDRFYRICRLGQQFSVRKARALCVVSVLLGLASAWPSLLLFGRHSVVVAPRGGLEGGQGEGAEEVWGVDCTTDDSVRGTIFPTIYVIFLFSLFFLTVAFFVVLYSRIGLEIWRRKRTTIGAKVAITTHPSKSALTSQSSDPTSTEISSGEAEEGKGGVSSKAPPLPAKSSQSPAEAGHGKSGGGNPGMRVGKTTTVLFVVTLGYVLSFLPYLVVMVMRSVIKDFEEGLSPAGEVVYKFCVKSFFINNAINPVIYSFLNASFRKDTRTLLRKMMCCRCCRSQQYGV